MAESDLRRRGRGDCYLYLQVQSSGSMPEKRAQQGPESRAITLKLQKHTATHSNTQSGVQGSVGQGKTLSEGRQARAQ